MANKHSYDPSVGAPGGAIKGTSHDYNGGGILLFQETIPASSTHLQCSLAIDVSALKSIVIVSDVALTLKFNSSGAPAPLLTLKAGVPYIWNTDSYDACLLAVDVTTLYVTSTVEAVLKISTIYDVTP